MSIFEDTTSNLINTSKATSRPMVTNGVYVGKVVRIDTEGRPYVLIPKVNPNAIFGPCKSFSYTTEINSLVAVTFLDNRLDEAVVLGGENSDEFNFAGQINCQSISVTGQTALSSNTSIGSVSSAEIAYLDGVSSSIQTQINGKVSITQPIRSVTAASDTPTISDLAKLLVINTSSGAVSITINGSLSLTAGQSIDFAWAGAATSVTFIASGLTGGSLNGTPGLKLRTRYSAATLKCLATNTYLLLGDLSA
jgi:hypothetical protein